MTKTSALRLRELIEKAVQSLPDDEALEGMSLFPAYKSGVVYEDGWKVRHAGGLYRVVGGELIPVEGEA